MLKVELTRKSRGNSGGNPGGISEGNTSMSSSSTVRCTIDLATKANPCLRMEDTSKNKKEHNLEYCG
jgi:hypothetical protein